MAVYTPFSPQSLIISGTAFAGAAMIARSISSFILKTRHSLNDSKIQRYSAFDSNAAPFFKM
jgi:hypothetical protein